jgi:endonuclease-8
VPEGDTVFLAATRLRAALAGQVLTRTDFRVPRFATADLSGRVLREVDTHGKHFLFRVDGGVTLHSHYKMEGSWHLYRHGERWQGPAFEARCVLENEAWVAVGFRLAITELLPTSEERAVVGHLGPDPLRPDWDAAEALRRLRDAGPTPIAEALLDQTRIAGPGNVYKCEICFLLGLDPWMPVAQVPDLAKVVDLTFRLMNANRTTGSQITTGDLRPGRQRWVYGRGGQPCRRCRTPVARRAEAGERVTYWCPRCQPARAGAPPAGASG